MKILLDTNIVIHRETNRVVRDDIGILFHWLDRLKFDKLIHPASIAEIQSHKDPEIVKTMTIKLGSYNVIQAVPETNVEVLRILGPLDTTPNDKIDTIILNVLSDWSSEAFSSLHSNATWSCRRRDEMEFQSVLSDGKLLSYIAVQYIILR